MPDKSEKALHDILEPYRNKKGKLREAMGDKGLRLLVEYVGPSPTACCEFLGYAKTTRGRMGKWLRAAGVNTQRRNHQLDTGRFEGGTTIDDLREHYLAETNRRERAPRIDWEIPRGQDEAKLILVSDLHYGHPAMDYQRWLELRDWIGEHETVRWIGLGDYLDMSTKNGPGGQSIMPYQKSRGLFIDDIKPIIGQCVGLAVGNHELRLERAGGINENPVQWIAQVLDVNYLDMDGWIRLHLHKPNSKQDETYDGRYHHGYTSARTPGGRLNKLRDMFRNCDADWIAMGHVHTLLGMEGVRAALDASGFVSHNSVPLQYSGSFLKHEQGSYPRRKGYPPTSLGAGTLIMQVNKHSCHARQ